MGKQSLQEILERVKVKVVPTPQERLWIRRTAEKFKARVETELERMGLEGEVRLEGSVAKDTWLRGDADIDLFILAPVEVTKETLSTAYLEAARRSLKDYRIVERFAEHPYVEASISRTAKINIVPCYKVKPPNWKSATDRTPYHTQYVNSKLNMKARDEVRLLKRFMKGVEVYGSDIKVGGFSGYLAELLVINFGGFLETLKAASTWKHGEILDVEGFYKGRLDEVESLFGGHCLTVVDPVDKARNGASPLRPETFNHFRASARFFLEKPHLKFFYPPKPRPPTSEGLKKLLVERGSDVLFLVLKRIEAVPDILWGQLYKTEKTLARLLEFHGFKVLRSAVWSDEERSSVIVYELEASKITNVRRHVGPPVSSREEKRFLEKYSGGRLTVSGPYIEGGRWVVLLKRKHTNAKALLLEKLPSGGRELGVASRVAESIVNHGFKVYVGGEIAVFYRRHSGFRSFLARFLSGKPPWL